MSDGRGSRRDFGRCSDRFSLHGRERKRRIRSSGARQRAGLRDDIERSWPSRRPSTRRRAQRLAADSFDDALLQLNILQTVVFSDHTFIHQGSHERRWSCSVPRRTNAGGLQAPGLRVQELPEVGGSKPEAGRRQFSISMVKLLRAYGECLGARCR